MLSLTPTPSFPFLRPLVAQLWMFRGCCITILESVNLIGLSKANNYIYYSVLLLVNCYRFTSITIKIEREIYIQFTACWVIMEYFIKLWYSSISGHKCLKVRRTFLKMSLNPYRMLLTERNQIIFLYVLLM